MLNQIGGQSIIVYDPNRNTEKLRQVTLGLAASKPSGGTVIGGGGLVVPLDNGRVVLIDWRTGAMGSPFQPASDPVGKVKWTNPVPLADDPDQVVLADSRKKIYRLRVGEAIRELASKDLEYEFLGSLAGVGDTVVGTTAGPAADFIVGLEMVSLNEKFKTLLNGRAVWGPIAAGNFCLIQTDDSILRGFVADGTQRFEVQLPPGLPVGEPLLVGNSIVLAGKTGWLVAIDSESGKLVGQSDLKQPISATPFPAGSRLLVPGAEGVVYITEVPAN
jgi:outer membrane protein assembly factor BamB